VYLEHYTVEAKYAMLADLYSVQQKRDANTGEIIREWLYVDTVKCLAKSIISSGVRTPSNDKTIDSRYIVEEIIKINTLDKLSRNAKISNIRDLSGKVLWEEAETLNNPPTVFNVVGSTPIIDAFGQILEYENTLQRSEIQNAFN
jgi:hypothetical protein